MISLAVVGLGRWGKVLIESVQGKSADVRFGAAVTRDPSAALDYCKPLGIVPLGSLDEALADPDIHGIVLATPHSRHSDEVVRCAAARKPVFVEKPFALTRESAARALAAANEAGIIVAAGHNRRWLPAIGELKRMIDAGELGTILHIETHFSGNLVGRYAADAWRVAPGESPAGGLAAMGIHQVDTIIHLGGPITEVYAVTTARIHDVPMDDATAVTFRLSSGGTASLLTLTATASLYRVQVFGTKGKAEIDGPAQNRGAEALDFTDISGDRARKTFEPRDIERAELESFAEAITGRKPYPISHRDILNGVAAFEAVPLSAESNRPLTIAG